MVERPILMSAPMVRAALSGGKTQTRRPMKYEPPEDSSLVVEVIHPTVVDKDGEEGPGKASYGVTTMDGDWCLPCPYGAPGERLWVRETFCWAWRLDKNTWTAFPMNGVERRAFFRATDPDPKDEPRRPWKPAIHMPRVACRLMLEIVAVRVERLLSISVEDCFAEGIELLRCPTCHLACYGLPGWKCEDMQKTPNEAYWHLWDNLNEKRGYGRSKNPWVWVIEFRREYALSEDSK